jgi:nucleoside-diphosphate-sugar epimerase
MQTILGAGGPIGTELAKALPDFADQIRLVCRHPRPVNVGDQLVVADLTKAEEVMQAVKGSDVVYLTVGLPYNTKIWQKQWPRIMRNVIRACKQENARLVFFDNIYMYDPDHLSLMSESTPIRPVSRKGVVRGQIADMLLKEVKAGNLQALIARSADFYGPSIRNNSVLTETVFNKLANRKKAQWLVSDAYKHSFTYTPDAGKALALLGNTREAFGQVWHLPTAENPPTGKEWIEMIAAALNVPPKYQVVSKGMLRFIGLFVPVMREVAEMAYQYDRPYEFNSGKFEKQFGVKPTSYEQGIREIVNRDYQNP